MLLPALMERIAQAAPGTSLRCFQVERRRIATEMAAGRLDLAVDISQLTAPVLNRYELLSDRYVCVLRKGHPLARSKLSLERYLALDHVTVSSRRHGSNYIDIALGRLGQRLTSPLRVQNFQPAIHVVQNSDMSLSAPEGLVRRYDVTIKELPFEIEPQPMVLFWHRNVDDDPANRWMRHLIADVALNLQ
jgi:DNA-binding transcriptional LysR family regulator